MSGKKAGPGRPLVDLGAQIGIKVPREMALRLRVVSHLTGKAISTLVRESLVREWGGPADLGRATREKHGA